MPRVLIYEGMPGHGECFASYYAYFTELGYDVSFVVRDIVAKENPLWMLNKVIPTYIIHTPAGNPAEMQEHLAEVARTVPDLTEYDLYFVSTFNAQGYKYVKFLNNHGIPKNKILHQNHMNYDMYLRQSKRDALFSQNGFILGTVDNDVLPQLSPSKNISNLSHPLLKTELKNKESISIFISGFANTHFKNFELFTQSIKELATQGIYFNIIVTGINIQKDNILPQLDCIKYINRADFKTMADYYCNSDFLLVLFDENALWAQEDHNSFLQGRVSGSRNMSITYKIPLVVQKPFQKIWGFNNTNSIGYEGHNYTEILLNLYNFKKENYNKIIKALEIKEKEEFTLGLNNLKARISALPTNIYYKSSNKKNDFLHY